MKLLHTTESLLTCQEQILSSELAMGTSVANLLLVLTLVILKQLFDAANRSHIASHRITLTGYWAAITSALLAANLAAVQPMIPPKTWPIMLLAYCRDAAGCTTQSTHAPKSPKSSKSSKHIIKTCVKIFVYVCCIENI